MQPCAKKLTGASADEGQMIRVVAFDFDGTLADTLELCLRAFCQAASPYLHREPSIPELVRHFGIAEEGMAHKLCPAHGEEVYRGYLREYESMHPIYCPAPFPGIKEGLARLSEAGARLALITGKGAESLKISLKTLGLENVFSLVFTGGFEYNKKSEQLSELLERTGVRPEECLYVGDVLSDITLSRQVGVKCLSVAWAKTANVQELKENNADFVFFSVDDLISYILTQL